MPIEIKHLTHVYMPGSPFTTIALDDVSLRVDDGEFIAVIGHTGSGKSTLIQHLNGLIKAQKGQVIINGLDLSDPKTRLKDVRRHVGLVFQYPEYQLFEETVYKDIAFGPKNLGLSSDEIDRRVRKALDDVRLGEDVLEKSPFELSGGQKRRVAIAGVLAMEPGILVLDEPTAGLDPKGRDEILALVKNWHQGGRTILMVSHSMDDVARLAQRIIVMNKGRIAMQGSPSDVFSRPGELQSIGLDVPAVTQLGSALEKCGFALPSGIHDMDEMELVLHSLLTKEEGTHA